MRTTDASVLMHDGELADIITEAITTTPRDLQREIGPSEIGVECNRRLAYKLAGVKEVNTDPDGKWRPAIGTAVHARLAELFTSLNATDQFRDRFLVEQRLLCGTINGREIWGSCDLYDTVRRTAIDWKIVGPTTLREVKRYGPTDNYLVQINTYCRGLAHAGYPVERGAIMYLPSNGRLSDRVYWCENYDPELPAAAFKRARAIDQAITAHGLSLLARLKTTNAHCSHCPWFAPGNEDIAVACPGDPSMHVDHSKEFEGLLPPTP